MAKKVNVALIGYKFMGKAHSNAFRQAPVFFDLDVEPVMKVLVGRDEAGVKAAAEKLGWESYATDYREVVNRPDIDLVDIVTGNTSHAEIAIAAAKAGKHVFCEKPLAMTVGEAREMTQVAEKAGVKHCVNFNYRKLPSIQLAKRLIDEGAIGRIFHWRSVYLQDWIVDPEFPLVWRLNKAEAGSGALGDLAAHSIDLAHFLVGDITAVTGHMETFIKERPVATSMSGLVATGSEERAPVTVDDGTIFLARFANGAIGTFEATRFAPGHRNGNMFEINGSEGSIRFNVERLNELEFYSRRDPAHAQGFRTISVTEGGEHRWINAWWPAGHIIGWEHSFTHQVVDLLDAIAQDKPATPDFRDGLRVQLVLDAVERSAQSGQWVSIEKE
ncbi:MAG TPA: Gfo/Idh/MocA family oxidoreductase [Armatimonadota bacterium]|nr:Gfo/Idh/MocA family oxidoreductase [Armatimonadota bacterium]HOM80496.1 Gfo/Idh/MocA family oxidoreductase [Armatimonadota bacterium]HPO71465.1 Gfo/Idh/MocA family oxidoreductase [Armatimonadota bacterium]HPT96873.1 Gfo/Idh/MocA family oxidoreductase [Armatimonadota bacterium]